MIEKIRCRCRKIPRKFMIMYRYDGCCHGSRKPRNLSDLYSCRRQTHLFWFRRQFRELSKNFHWNFREDSEWYIEFPRLVRVGTRLWRCWWVYFATRFFIKFWRIFLEISNVNQSAGRFLWNNNQIFRKSPDDFCEIFSFSKHQEKFRNIPRNFWENSAKKWNAQIYDGFHNAAPAAREQWLLNPVGQDVYIQVHSGRRLEGTDSWKLDTSELSRFYF